MLLFLNDFVFCVYTFDTKVLSNTYYNPGSCTTALICNNFLGIYHFIFIEPVINKTNTTKSVGSTFLQKPKINKRLKFALLNLDQIHILELLIHIQQN